MKEGGKGGHKTLTGLKFEREIDFQKLLMRVPNYEIKPLDGKLAGVFFIKTNWSHGVLESMTFINSLMKKASTGKAWFQKDFFLTMLFW